MLFVSVITAITILLLGCNGQQRNVKTSFQSVQKPIDRQILYHVNTENLRQLFSHPETKVVCYYNSKSHHREGNGKFEVFYLEPALQHCTHLIYGYAAINEDTHKLIPLNEHFDVIKDNYRKVTDLKQKYPKLKVVLSVGGNADIGGEGSDRNLKYRTLLENSAHRLTFINSAVTLLKGFGFDGLDLAWEFPENKPKKIRGTLGSLWHSIKKKVGANGEIDDKPQEHKEQFVSLVRELKHALRSDNLLLSLTVLPNVNSSIYYDVKALSPNVDFVNLHAFDFYTPERNPKEADYPAPLYELIDRKLDENVDGEVRYWLTNGAPPAKIVLGIPTFGRAWKLDDESDINGMPPLHVDGPADQGPLTKEAGLLSYTEICQMLRNDFNTKGHKSPHALKRTGDPTKRKGTFAFRLPDENNNGGLWVGYEDTDSVSNKAAYAKAKGLGGVAIVDLTLDDFKAQCEREKYPLLRTAILHL